MRVAIFDFDGTLYKRETFPLLMDHLKKHPTHHVRYRSFFKQILPIYIAYKLKLYPETKMKEKSMKFYFSALDGLKKEDSAVYFQEIAERMKQDFNQVMIKKLTEHINNNDYTMVVSGAYTTLLKATLEEFSIDQFIATDIPINDNTIDKNGNFYHIQGERKKEEVMQALANKNIDWDNSYSYGDSRSDLPVLEIVGNPVAVQPDAQLKEIAIERSWEIV